MATYPSSPANFAQPTASTGYYFAFDSKTNGTHSYPYYAKYELFQSNGNYHDSTSGFVIRWNSTTSKNEINVQDSGLDNNSNDPTHYKVDNGSIVDGGVWSEIESGSTVTIYKNATGTTWGDPLVIGSSHLWSASSPSVSSITEDTIFVPDDTVVASDFTLEKNTASYATTNISLSGPGPQLPSDARGYSYSLTLDGSAWYSRTIDSKTYGAFEYDDSWEDDVSGAASGRQTTSNRILNVLAKFPTNTVITGVPSDYGTPVHHDRHITYRKVITANEDYKDIGAWMSVVENSSTNEDDVYLTFYYREINDNKATWYQAQSFVIGGQETINWTATDSGNNNISLSITDWIYEEPEGDGYTPPPVNTGGNGKPRDGYPIIMTNLFNRQRSIFSIGMTHKTHYDPFI